MSQFTETLELENKAYLPLLQRLTQSIAPFHRVSTKGLEALLSIDASASSEQTQASIAEKFMPVDMGKLMQEFGNAAPLAKRGDTFARALLAFPPNEHSAHLAQAFLYSTMQQKDALRNVPITHFKEQYVLGTLPYSYGIPDTVDLLGNCWDMTPANVYFALFQFMAGIPTHRDDRLSENLFTLFEFEQKDPREFEQEVANSDEDNHKNPFDMLMRLESEYLKTFMFHGNILPSELDTLGFLTKVYERFFEKKEDISELLRDEISHERSYCFDKSPVEFLSLISPTNFTRMFETFGVQTYEKMLETIIDLPLEVPDFLRVNRIAFPDDETYRRLLHYVFEIHEVSSSQDSYLSRKVSEYIFDNAASLFKNIPFKEQTVRFLFEAMEGLPDFDRYSSSYKQLEAFTENGVYLSSALKEQAIPLLKALYAEQSDTALENIHLSPKVFAKKRFRKVFAKQNSGEQSRETLDFLLRFETTYPSFKKRLCDGTLSFENLHAYSLQLQKEGIVPTPRLVELLNKSSEPYAVLAKWKDLLANRFHNDFSATNPLHVQLGYTQFRHLLTTLDEDTRKHKNVRFKRDFATYQQLLKGDLAQKKEKEFSWGESLSSKRGLFEVECAAYESLQLYAFLKDVQKDAQRLNKEVVVVPNLSYGYLPLIPLHAQLLDENFKVFLGAKIGSTQSHDDPSVFNGELFKGIEDYILREQPIMVVVDGTQHLLGRDGDGKEARYPDAHQGFFNHVIALNDAAGHVLAEYVGRSKETVTSLRQKNAYTKYVEEIRKSSKQNAPYSFQVYNTANLPLSTRKKRKAVPPPVSYSSGELHGPTMIFCNVGMLHEQLPESLRDNEEGFMHLPAYFDDTAHIVDLELAVTANGISAKNSIEELLFRAYQKVGAKSVQPTDESLYVHQHPNLIRHATLS